MMAACPPVSASESVLVFAAASLTDAVSEVAGRYQESTGVGVKLSFAASSTLGRQIEAGAPAQIFVSANESWMDQLQASGLIIAESRIAPVGNALVLIAPIDSRLPPFNPGPDSNLLSLLGGDGRLALGDPAHVPAGTYAREALQKLGLWSALESRLALADNVRAALALVSRGEAPLGIVYATDASVGKVRVLGTFPASSHAPIRYPVAIVRGGNTAPARAFFEFLTGDVGLGILERHGFQRLATE
jgi:molybdate transport system substrate-binding protein